MMSAVLLDLKTYLCKLIQFDLFERLFKSCRKFQETESYFPNFTSWLDYEHAILHFNGIFAPSKTKGIGFPVLCFRC